MYVYGSGYNAIIISDLPHQRNKDATSSDSNHLTQMTSYNCPIQFNPFGSTQPISNIL